MATKEKEESKGVAWATKSDGTEVGADGLPLKPGASASMPEDGPTNKAEAPPLIVTPPQGDNPKLNPSKEVEMAKTETEKTTTDPRRMPNDPLAKDPKQAPSAGEMTAENEPPDLPREPSVLDPGGTPVRKSVKDKEDAEAQWTPESGAELASKKHRNDDDDDDDNGGNKPGKPSPNKEAAKAKSMR